MWAKIEKKRPQPLSKGQGTRRLILAQVATLKSVLIRRGNMAPIIAKALTSVNCQMPVSNNSFDVILLFSINGWPYSVFRLLRSRPAKPRRQILNLFLPQRSQRTATPLKWLPVSGLKDRAAEKSKSWTFLFYRRERGARGEINDLLV